MQKGLLLAILVSLVFTVQSQDQKIKLGLHFSPNLASTHGRGPILRDYRKLRIDFALGLDLAIPIGEKISIKSGLEYEGKGGKIAFPATDANAMLIGTKEIIISQDYIQIPLLASYKISKGNTHIYFDLGPYGGYLVAAKTIDKPLGQYEGGEYNHTSDHKSFEFGMMGGLGIAFMVSKNIEGSIAIHDHLGLTDISKPQFSNVPMRTHTIGLRLGAMVRI